MTTQGALSTPTTAAERSRYVAAEVRAELGRQNLSERRLATEIGMTQSQISWRMQAKGDFRVTELLAIADVLGVPVTNFLPRTPAVFGR